MTFVRPLVVVSGFARRLIVGMAGGRQQGGLQLADAHAGRQPGVEDSQ
jgi:hypothetical protein